MKKKTLFCTYATYFPNSNAYVGFKILELWAPL